MIPNIKGGIITAILFTFIPTLGSFAIPDLVGGPNTYMLGNVIAYNLRTANNWPLASAISLVLTILTGAGLLLYFLFNRAPQKVVLQGKRHEQEAGIFPDRLLGHRQLSFSSPGGPDCLFVQQQPFVLLHRFFVEMVLRPVCKMAES